MLGPAYNYTVETVDVIFIYLGLLFVADYQNTKPKICDAGEYILDIIIIKFAAVKTKHAQPWTFAECPTFSVETQEKQTTETETL